MIGSTHRLQFVCGECAGHWTVIKDLDENGESHLTIEDITCPYCECRS